MVNQAGFFKVQGIFDLAELIVGYIEFEFCCLKIVLIRFLTDTAGIVGIESINFSFLLMYLSMFLSQSSVRIFSLFFSFLK